MGAQDVIARLRVTDSTRATYYFLTNFTSEHIFDTRQFLTDCLSAIVIVLIALVIIALLWRFNKLQKPAVLAVAVLVSLIAVSLPRAWA